MTTPARAIELDLSSGRIRAHRFGPDDGKLTLCVHGLSANSRSYDYLGPELAAHGRSVVAIDLRGRGWSAITGLGTYGWSNHARDVLAVATALGAERFEYVGHSMGAFIGLEPRSPGALPRRALRAHRRHRHAGARVADPHRRGGAAAGLGARRRRHLRARRPQPRDHHPLGSGLGEPLPLRPRPHDRRGAAAHRPRSRVRGHVLRRHAGAPRLLARRHDADAAGARGHPPGRRVHRQRGRPRRLPAEGPPLAGRRHRRQPLWG